MRRGLGAGFFSDRSVSIIAKKEVNVYHRRLYFACHLVHYKHDKRGGSVRFDNRAVGQTIRRLRMGKGLSQDVLSGLAGMARTHLTMIESGDKQPNFETIWKIALALDMQPSTLVAEIEAEITNSV